MRDARHARLDLEPPRAQFGAASRRRRVRVENRTVQPMRNRIVFFHHRHDASPVVKLIDYIVKQLDLYVKLSGWLPTISPPSC
ncbi:hypothetical protein Acsp02_30920 [Actinoplanes sp. NBRC 103695]|nr:hypothetical protein Acsp02_30920 [Actinoplanes sp. NBRC 103695]